MSAGNSDSVWLHRGPLSLLGKLGLRWAGGREVAMILQGEKFLRLQSGPGFFVVVPGFQRVALTITVIPDPLLLTLDDIQTRDGLRISVVLALEYLFDPRTPAGMSELDKAALSRRFEHVADRRGILTVLTQRALQAAAAGYPAEQICRGEVWDALEDKLFAILGDKLAPLGMRVYRDRSAIQKAIAPDMLNWRLEMAAQRAVNIENLSQYEPYEVAQALRTEAVEALKNMSGGSPYLNLHDLAAADAPPANRALPGRSEPQAEEPPARARAADKPKKPISRL